MLLHKAALCKSTDSLDKKCSGRVQGTLALTKALRMAAMAPAYDRSHPCIRQYMTGYPYLDVRSDDFASSSCKCVLLQTLYQLQIAHGGQLQGQVLQSLLGPAEEHTIGKLSKLASTFMTSSSGDTSPEMLQKASRLPNCPKMRTDEECSSFAPA